jgi:hypothetical protein
MQKLNSKKIVFVFKDGSTKEFDLGDSIKGVKKNGERPVKVVLKFNETDDLTEVEKENLYCGVIPALHPMLGKVVYE